jgi:hypothetical protein
MISIDGRRLLLLQREVVSLESVLEVRRAGGNPREAGSIEWAGEAWPVFCLAGEALATTVLIPSERRFCLLLYDGEHRLALVCDQIEMLGPAPRRRYPLPACLAKPDGLVDLLVVREETVDCLTTTSRLAAFCRRDAFSGSENG